MWGWSGCVGPTPEHCGHRISSIERGASGTTRRPMIPQAVLPEPGRQRHGTSGPAVPPQARPFPWGTLFVHSLVVHRPNGHQLQSGDRSTRRSSRTRSVAEHGPRRYWVRVRAPGAGWARVERGSRGPVHALTKAPRCSMLPEATRPTRRSGQSAQSTLPVTTRQTPKHNVTPGRYMATERNPRPRSRSLISRSRRARKHKTRTP